MSLFQPMDGPAKGVKGAWPFEELQLQQVRLLPNDNSTINSRSEIDLVRNFNLRHAGRSLACTPLIAANMFGTGTIPMAEELAKHKMLVAFEKHLPAREAASFLIRHRGQTGMPSLGFREKDEQNLTEIFNITRANAPRAIVIDVPNGHMVKMLETVARYRSDWPEVAIIAGNVATGSMAAKLVMAGADIVKVGIGPGSACTTKMIAGTHRPQFAAVRECAEVVHTLGGHVVADGGVKTAGDAAIALAAGADFVMIGGAFAAHDESGQPIYKDDKGREWQEFMGSSSAAYMTRTQGEVAHYRAAEGELQWIPHKGSITAPGAIIQELLGGLRSAFSYAGARSPEEFSNMARATYSGEEGGLQLVKAQIDSSGGGKGQPSRIVGGRPNPITGAMPRMELIQS